VLNDPNLRIHVVGVMSTQESQAQTTSNPLTQQKFNALGDRINYQKYMKSIQQHPITSKQDTR